MFFKKKKKELSKLEKIEDYIAYREASLIRRPFKVPFKIEVEDFITIPDKDAFAFELKPIQTVKKKTTQEAVARVRIEERDLDEDFVYKVMGKMIDGLTDSGFPRITFVRPDGGYLRLTEHPRGGYELRAVGYQEVE